MIAALTNHIWQSTVFAVVTALLTLAFRKNRAHVRYWLWLSASLKFLLPFSLLIALGSRLEWAPASRGLPATSAITLSMVPMSQPFFGSSPAAPPASRPRDWNALLIGVWACGFAGIALLRFRGWRRIRAALRASTPFGIPATIRIRSTPGLLEPGVVGLFRPVLLLPAGIADRLTPPQLQAVLAHELCHIQRRDNLTSALHMIVEAVFWFHPLVWWIGARLIEDRERACDEAVLSLGHQPRDYATGILNVCKSYLESPLSCVSGVTGSSLKKRIQAILAAPIARDLTFARKLTLAAAGLVALGVPIAVGSLAAPRVDTSSPLVAPKFQTASIEPCEAFSKTPLPESPGRLQSGCTTLQRFMQEAYGPYANARVNPSSSVTITGGPAWTDSDFYSIDAKAGHAVGQVMMKGPMLRALLEDRFKLKIRREIRSIPVYALTVAKDGAKLQPFRGSCIPWDYDHPNPGPRQCATARAANNAIEMKGWTMADLCYFLLVTLRQPIIDKTGNSGRFNAHLELSTGAADYLRHGLGAPARTDLGSRAANPALVSGIEDAMKKLGLIVAPTTAPGEFIVIDHVERP